MMVIIFNSWQFIIKGGAMMWPLIFLSIVALAVGIEKVVQLASIEKILKIHKVKLMTSLQQESIKDVLKLCESSPSSFSRIFKAAVLKFGNSAELIKASMEEVFLYETHRIQERMSMLAFIINASVLIGLLGTVVGLAVVFQSVQVRSNILNPLSVGDMSAGIWQALFSTVVGLTVCIFTLAVYNFCISKINNIIADLRISMAQLVHVLLQLSELRESSKDE